MKLDLDIQQEYILDNLHDGLYIVDKDREIRYWNKSAEQFTGYSNGEMVHTHCWDGKLAHVDEEGNHLCDGPCPLAQTMADGQLRDVDVFLHHKHGYRIPVNVRTTPLRDEQGEIIGGVQIFFDNSGKVNMREELKRLEQLAMLDPLTELGNRRFAEESIQSMLSEFQRYQGRFGLLFIDIDHFKKINDVHGHEVGDNVLQVVAKTLSKNVRVSDLVCRWGGEEFVGVFRNVDVEILGKLAEKLRVLVSRSAYSHEDQPIQVTVSLGGTLAQDKDTPETIVRRADELMYQAKNAGRNTTHIS